MNDALLAARDALNDALALIRELTEVAYTLDPYTGNGVTPGAREDLAQIRERKEPIYVARTKVTDALAAFEPRSPLEGWLVRLDRDLAVLRTHGRDAFRKLEYPAEIKLEDDITGLRSNRDVADDISLLAQAYLRAQRTCVSRGEVINRAWHYMQSPESYSAEERQFVFDGLDSVRREEGRPT